MAAFGGGDWSGGFPFTANRLRDLPRNAISHSDVSRVTAAGIPEEGRALSSLSSETQPVRASAASGRIVMPDALRARAMPASRRFAPRRASLRLLPLGAFVWGSDSTPPQPRTRPDHTLLWVTQGGLGLGFPRRNHLMMAGDLRYIPAGTAFAALPGPGTEGHVLLLSPDMVGDMEPPLPSQTISGAVCGQAEALLVNLRELADEAARGADRRALLCHLNLLSMRLTRLEPEPQRGPAPEERTANHPLVAQFTDLAAQDLAGCRALADLAQDLGTTLTTLDRACLAARGKRAVDLLNDLRLERGAELLRNTGWSGARIAQELGYSSHAHFTRAFVAATGRTPDVFRAQMGRDRDSDGLA
ncbi:MAG: helix-turn-helix domain-containing protein [Paracoccus sp. (in: a-proteobacteria)]